MAHEVKRTEFGSPSRVTVVYVAETQTLYIENGRLREDAEEMADGVLVYYDKHDEASAVALCIEPADIVLKPFVDAVLVKHGVKPKRPTATNQNSDKTCHNQCVRYQAPPAQVEYDPKGQILRIENGQFSEVGEEIAEDVIVHYDKDDDHAPASVVAIRIDRAEQVLKPFVDAILAKYGVKTEHPLVANETED
ncbi:MAG: DUF2283 domain-containing protein [Chloroflexota bacterium]|nr:DUF2283 domain-containing protein [Chloroflexota bacterium]MDE2959982.1 DUF2283 domain-containing protein [Chloroflexota bacterium]